MSRRIRSLKEKNAALRSQSVKHALSAATQIINEPPAARAVTFTPIAVNTLNTNYGNRIVTTNTHWCISATHGVYFIINNGISISVRGSSPTFSDEYYSSTINWLIYRAGMKPVLNQSTSSANITLASTPSVSSIP